MIVAAPKYVVLPVKEILDRFINDTDGMLDTEPLNYLVDAIGTVSDDDASGSETFNYIDQMKADMAAEFPEEVVQHVANAFFDMASATRELLELHHMYDNPDRVIDYVFKQQHDNAVILERWDEDTMAEE